MLCLAVLTLLGIAGMQSARLELLVADNRHQQSTALANTEYVLAAGEQAVLQLRTNPFHPDVAGDPFYPAGMRDLDPGTPENGSATNEAPQNCNSPSRPTRFGVATNTPFAIA